MSATPAPKVPPWLAYVMTAITSAGVSGYGTTALNSRQSPEAIGTVVRAAVKEELAAVLDRMSKVESRATTNKEELDRRDKLGERMAAAEARVDQVERLFTATIKGKP